MCCSQPTYNGVCFAQLLHGRTHGGKRNYHVSIPSVLVLLIPFPSKAIHNPYPKHANYSYLGLCDAWARSESQYHKGSWLMTAYSPKKSNITAGICLPQSPLGTPNDRHLLCQRGVASDWARGNATGFYSSVHRFYWIKTALLWTMYTIPWIAPILIYIWIKTKFLGTKPIQAPEHHF